MHYILFEDEFNKLTLNLLRTNYRDTFMLFITSIVFWYNTGEYNNTNTL